MNIRLLLSVLKEFDAVGFPEMEATGVAIDSRAVCPGNVFVCLQGHASNGHHFAQKAVENGAIAIIIQDEVRIDRDIPFIKTASTKEAYSLLCQQWTEQVWKKMRHIAVTGTTGKTTIAWLIHQMLNQLGEKSGLIGTAGYYEGLNPLSVKLKGPLTTPMPGELHSLFSTMHQHQCKNVCLEASSFGISQKRLHGMLFDVAVLSNLSYNHHVEFHGGWNPYVQAKKELFSMLCSKGTAVINADINEINDFQNLKPMQLWYGENSRADIRIVSITSINDEYMVFKYQYDNTTYEVQTALKGRFQAWNLAAAFGTGIALSYSPARILNILGNLASTIPGRWQTLLSKKPFTVIVDKANTPIAFQSIKSMLQTSRYSKKIAVFGNFGGGDPVEKAMLATLIAQTYDKLILTLDDPGDEAIKDNFDDFMKGIPPDFTESVLIIPSRKKAFKKALELAEENDLIVLLGRGNQSEFLYRSKKIPFNDVDVMRSLLKEKGFLS